MTNSCQFELLGWPCEAILALLPFRQSTTLLVSSSRRIEAAKIRRTLP